MYRDAGARPHVDSDCESTSKVDKYQEGEDARPIRYNIGLPPREHYQHIQNYFLPLE
jgi:hypothetical protein